MAYSEAMPNRKTCPIKLAGDLGGGFPVSSDWHECSVDTCAWWDSRRSRCGMLPVVVTGHGKEEGKMTYPEVVKALEEEFGGKVSRVGIAPFKWPCCNCSSVETTLFEVHHEDSEFTSLCADRPACRKRAKRQRDERERAVVEAVKL